MFNGSIYYVFIFADTAFLLGTADLWYHDVLCINTLQEVEVEIKQTHRQKPR